MKTLDQKSVDESHATSRPILELRNVSKYYGDAKVLDGVSFELLRGETKIILGGSGSGKSTMLKLMMGLARPDEGQVLIEGLDITNMSERMLSRVRPKVGMVFQESGLFDSMSVFENVAYRLFELKVDEDLVEERVKTVLGFVGLAEAIDKLPSELSGGMKRRVALARALISEPAIMLYDEPTAGLDPVTSREINELINRLPDSYSYNNRVQKLRWLTAMSRTSGGQRYADSCCYLRFTHERKRELYTDSLWNELEMADSSRHLARYFDSDNAQHTVDRMLYTDVMTQLPEYGVMIVDRTTMAFSLESRSPFLDRKVAEFCAVLPTHLKIRRHRLRYLERELARKYLPPEVVSRRKQGFGLPLGYWFKGELGTVAEDLFRNSSLADAGWLTQEGLLSVLEEHRVQGIDHSHRLWMLLNLEMWYRIFIEGRGVEAVLEHR